LKNYDDSQNGAYFITICTKNHEELFGTVGEATCLPLPLNLMPIRNKTGRIKVRGIT